MKTAEELKSKDDPPSHLRNINEVKGNTFFDVVKKAERKTLSKSPKITDTPIRSTCNHDEPKKIAFSLLNAILKEREELRKKDAANAPPEEVSPEKEKELELDNSALEKSDVISRERMTKMLKEVFRKDGLTNRKAAKLTGISRRDFERVASGEATIDKSVEVLNALGYAVLCSATRTR